MPRVASRLSDIHVRRLNHTGPKTTKSGKPRAVYVSVGGCAGLQIQVFPSGAKTWVLKTTVGDKRREIGLGPYAAGKATRKKKINGEGPAGVTLEAARQEGLRIKDQIKKGIDPVAQKKSKKSQLAAQRATETTFAELAEEFVTQIAMPQWKTLKQVTRLRQYLRDYVNPHIGNLLVKDIKPVHLIKMHQSYYDTLKDSSRVLTYVRQIFEIAILKELRPDNYNPALWSGNLERAFPTRSKAGKTKHQRSVDWQLMPEFMPKLLALGKTREEARCLAFQILTVARPSEARLADWSEMDLEQKVWFIPNSDAELRKSDKDWMIPLSREAIKILKAQGPKKKGRIFNNNGNAEVIPDNYISSIPDALGYDGVAHGFRSTFETWEQETQDKQWSPDAVRLAMKHVNSDKVRAAYARSQCFPERMRLTRAWENWLFKGETSAIVVPIRPRAVK